MSGSNLDTREVQALLRRVDEEVFPSWARSLSAAAATQDELGPILEGIQRARREFDSRLFFVVIFGPVKSGKSTLVNSLTRQYVSPTKFAREGTRRSSIVLQSSESGIDQYFSERCFRMETEKARRDFEKVIERLRGVAPETEDLGSVRKETNPFTRENIESLLSEDLSVEPLLTVIRVPDAGRLSQEVAILDVPGLDGKFSNARESPELYWILDKADLLLFVQSSFAPLNNETSGFLKDLYMESRCPPVWLIQNRVEAKQWLPQAEQDSENESQIENAKTEICSVLGIEKSALSSVSMNLGKAFDGLFRGREDWVTDSGFPQFEEFINATLLGDRAQLRLRSSLGELAHQVEATQTRLSEIIALKRTSVHTHNQIVDRLSEIKTSLGRLDYQTERSERVFEEFLRLRLMPKLDDRMRSVEGLCRDAYARFCREGGDGKSDPRPQYRGREVNQFLKVFGAELGSDFSEDIFDLNGTLGKELRERLNGLAHETESALLEKVSHDIEGIGLEAPESPSALGFSGLPELSRRPLSLELFKETKFLFGIIPWPASYPSGAVEGKFRNDLPKDIAKLFEMRLTQWTERLKTRYYRACLETRFLPTMGRVEELISEQLRLVNRAEAEKSEVETVAAKIRADLQSLSEQTRELVSNAVGKESQE